MPVTPASPYGIDDEDTLSTLKHNRRLGPALGAFVVMALFISGCGKSHPTLSDPDPKLRVTSTTAATTATTATTTATTAPSKTTKATKATKTTKATKPTKAPPISGGTTAAPRGGTSAPPATTTIPPTNGPTSGAPSLAAGSANMHGFIATPVGDPAVHVAPDASSARISIPRINSAGVRTVFAVIGDADKPWIQVLLPTRPNGATGWVERSSVQIATTNLAMFVDLGSRRLSVRRGGQTVMEAPIAVGTTTNPTPTGPSYITELLDTGNPNGAYGRYAYGLALHSNTLSEFAGGDGQVGVHGTNEPGLIGQRVSHGCVRLNNADVLRLLNLQLPLGTPVFVS